MTDEEGAESPRAHTTDTTKGVSTMCKKILNACVVSIACFVTALLIDGRTAQGQHQYPTAEVPTSEGAYVAKVKTAAPAEIVSKASITMMQQGTPRELQAGSNG